MGSDGLKMGFMGREWVVRGHDEKNGDGFNAKTRRCQDAKERRGDVLCVGAGNIKNLERTALR